MAGSTVSDVMSRVGGSFLRPQDEDISSEGSLPTFNGKELIQQFERLCVNKKTGRGSHDPAPPSSPSLRIVRKKPWKRKKSNTPAVKVILRQSLLGNTLVMEAAVARAAVKCVDSKRKDVYRDFSVACCKELETIELSDANKKGASFTRPRSSSLPGGERARNERFPSVVVGSRSVAVNSRSRRRKTDIGVNSGADLRTYGLGADCVASSDAIRVAQKRKKLSASCAQQARNGVECGRNSRRSTQEQEEMLASIDRLTDYLDESILLPKKMSYMAEMMYT